jgi:hypothetical protein
MSSARCTIQQQCHCDRKSSKHKHNKQSMPVACKRKHPSLKALPVHPLSAEQKATHRKYAGSTLTFVTPSIIHHHLGYTGAFHNLFADLLCRLIFGFPENI